MRCIALLLGLLARTAEGNNPIHARPKAPPLSVTITVQDSAGKAIEHQVNLTQKVLGRGQYGLVLAVASVEPPLTAAGREVAPEALACKVTQIDFTAAEEAATFKRLADTREVRMDVQAGSADGMPSYGKGEGTIGYENVAHPGNTRLPEI